MYYDYIVRFQLFTLVKIELIYIVNLMYVGSIIKTENAACLCI